MQWRSPLDTIVRGRTGDRSDPLYAILTDPKYRHGGGDRAEFRRNGGEDFAAAIMRQCEALGSGPEPRASPGFRMRGGASDAPRSRSGSPRWSASISPRAWSPRPGVCMRSGQLLLRGAAGERSAPVPRWLVRPRPLCAGAPAPAVAGGHPGLPAPSSSGSCAPGGALVVQLPSTVPPPTPVPPWRTRAGLRLRAATFLRRVGVSPQGPVPACWTGSPK